MMSAEISARALSISTLFHPMTACTLLEQLIMSIAMGGIIIIPLNFWCSIRKGDIDLRKRFLEKVKKWLVENLEAKKEFSPHQKLLLKHHLNLLSAEENFLNDIVGIVKNY